MSLKRAINRTIKYAGKFGGGLTATELETRLLSSRRYPPETIREVFGNNKGQEPEDIKRKKEFQTIKLNKTKEFIEKELVKIRPIILVGVSGSVAAGYPEGSDDIDLVIVTKRDRLWLARLWLKLVLVIRGIPHRRRGKEEKRDEFCFNLWLEEGSLALPIQKRNQRNAVDLVMLVPIFDRNDCYRKLLENNNWASKFVATGYAKRMGEIMRPVACITDKRKGFCEWLNYAAYFGQRWWMTRKVKREVINRHQAFFHPDG